VAKQVTPSARSGSLLSFDVIQAIGFACIHGRMVWSDGKRSFAEEQVQSPRDAIGVLFLGVLMVENENEHGIFLGVLFMKSETRQATEDLSAMPRCESDHS